MNKSTDLGLVAAFGQRTSKADPGTRGPHLDLFRGGTPTAKSETPSTTLAAEVAEFANARKLDAGTAKVLEVVLDAFAAEDAPVRLDAFDLGQRAKLSREDAAAARDRLMSIGALRTNANNAFGLDGLAPGGAWLRRYEGRGR